MEKPLIKVAVPNKGALSEPAAEMLREAGYAQRSDGDLALLDELTHGQLNEGVCEVKRMLTGLIRKLNTNP